MCPPGGTSGAGRTPTPGGGRTPLSGAGRTPTPGGGRPVPAARVPGSGIRRGTPEFRRLILALFAASLAVFGCLFAPQPLLPLLSAEFGVSPATASLAISVTTGTMAVAVLPLSSLSEIVGRTRMMTVSVAVTAVLGLVAAFVPSFPLLVAARGLQGVALAGLPAVGMAYVSEEVERASAGFAMGLYVAGNGVAGMAGRLLSGLAADLGGWRSGLAAVGVLAVCCAGVFRVTAPASARFRPAPARLRSLVAGVGDALADGVLRRLYLLALVLLASFITVYNYLGYRLLEAPFGLSAGIVGTLYVVYLAGSVSSTAAGRLADRYGRRRVLWVAVLVALGGLALMLPDNLPLVATGLTVLTAGFFAAHALASGWVGRRASTSRGQATGLYVTCYYAGSSIGGYGGGLAYGAAGWPGMTAMVGALLLAALALGLSLRTVAPR